MFLRQYWKYSLAPAFSRTKLFFFFGLSLHSDSWNHIITTKDRDCDPDPVLNQSTYYKVIPLPHGPGIPSFFSFSFVKMATLKVWLCSSQHRVTVPQWFYVQMPQQTSYWVHPATAHSPNEERCLTKETRMQLVSLRWTHALFCWLSNFPSPRSEICKCTFSWWRATGVTSASVTDKPLTVYKIVLL